MWKDTIFSLVLNELDTLEIYTKLSEGKNEVIDDITLYIINGISMQPWFFEFVIKVIAFQVNLTVFILKFKRLSRCDSAFRNEAITKMSKIPIINLLNKFVRNLTLLRIFDLIDIKNI